MCTTRIDKDRAFRGRVWAGGIRGSKNDESTTMMTIGTVRRSKTETCTWRRWQQR
jgi:hypothetical protein